MPQIAQSDTIGRFNEVASELEKLKKNDMYRSLPFVEVVGGGMVADRAGNKLVDLSSNDYLALAGDETLREEFFRLCKPKGFSSSSSRLMSGFDTDTVELENRISRDYNREAALIFSSGYHANTSILSAICNSDTLILADKLVHASLIDGIRLSKCEFRRFEHNNMKSLERILESKHADYKHIIIVSESTFSMDGDKCDLRFFVELKHRFDNVLLYIDSAHDVGTTGNKGLGEPEEQGVLNEIDFIVATFGKGLASYGAFVVCDGIVKEFLVNKARGLIFSTALSPIQMQWTRFVWEQLPNFADRRTSLASNASYFRSQLQAKGIQTPSASHIVPIIIGQASETLRKSEQLRSAGFHCLAVRPPTVPQNLCRLRLSINSAMTKRELDAVLACL